MPNGEIDPNSGVPLYRQIKDILTREITSGQVDTTVPMTEAQLLERFGVSRAPIRQALRELTDAGYVYRKQGKGTFPVPGRRVDRPLEVRLGALQQFLSEHGLEATSKVSRPARVPAPSWLQEKLNATADEQLLHYTRLITVDGEPLADAEIFLRAPVGFNPAPADLEGSDSTFDLLEREYGVVLERAEHEASAISASSAHAARLKVPKGSPLLLIETVFVATGGVPLAWRVALHKADEFRYKFVSPR